MDDSTQLEVSTRSLDPGTMQRYDGPPIQGWMDTEELLWLFGMASQMKNVVEVGSWKGRSTHALLSGCRGTVYAVDTWLGSLSQINDAHAEAKTKDIFSEFMQNVGHFKNLVPMRMHSVRAARLFANKWVDMVFIDADHFYEPFRKDVEAWLPKCRKVLCGHDIHEGGVEVALVNLKLPYRKVGVGSIWRVDL